MALPEEVLLTIEVDGRSLSRLSCSPFGRKELVLGWMFSQGLVADAGRRRRFAHPGRPGPGPLAAGGGAAPGAIPPGAGGRLLGRRRAARPVLRPAQGFPGLSPLPGPGRPADGAIAQQVEMFRKHGGIHCSMLADMKEQSILVSREDIGRSNSVDKVIGWGLAHGADFSRSALFITGRVSAEMAIEGPARRHPRPRLPDHADQQGPGDRPPQRPDPGRPRAQAAPDPAQFLVTWTYFFA